MGWLSDFEFTNFPLSRGFSGTGSTGSAEPVDFGRRVLEPFKFSGKKIEKDRNSEVYHLLVSYRLI